MTNDVQCSSGQWLKQESGKSSKNIISIRIVLSNGTMLSNGNHHTDYEEVSVKLGLQRGELATSRGATTNSDVPRPSAPSTNTYVSSLAHHASQVSEVKVLSNWTILGNGNHNMGQEGFSVMLGLQRVDFVCGFEQVENFFIKGPGPNAGMMELATSNRVT
ncbi:hypothetical protein Tco_0282372 [Tanacetum coccineum]